MFCWCSWEACPFLNRDRGGRNGGWVLRFRYYDGSCYLAGCTQTIPRSAPNPMATTSVCSLNMGSEVLLRGKLWLLLLFLLFLWGSRSRSLPLFFPPSFSLPLSSHPNKLPSHVNSAFMLSVPHSPWAPILHLVPWPSEVHLLLFYSSDHRGGRGGWAREEGGKVAVGI